MTRLRTLLTGLVVALLVLTSQQMAMARGQLMDVSGQIVLCQGGVAVIVSVDSEGNPVGPAHICPDCAMSLFVDMAPAPAFKFEPLGAEFRDVIYWTAPVSTAQAGARFARGPPLIV